MIKENQGQKPRRVEIWKKGRVRVDGSILESARETYEKVVAADEKITSSGTVDIDDIEHDALNEMESKIDSMEGVMKAVLEQVLVCAPSNVAVDENSKAKLEQVTRDVKGFQMGIALPQFLLSIDGASGGILLLGIVEVCILFPLVAAVIFSIHFAVSSLFSGKL
ncbi:hypothetical protein FRX31_032376 [Thalictrum thalictroides]|uniref:Uncharacterized protein n=1 Tax=Thalictrum thalictroides TaxID=46969 RepID=A0A7J6UZG0_THATH|nr:hypothetical protein FRX31_032376 [Thalictrum thalictroides]